jgi:hypothetical protein
VRAVTMLRAAIRRDTLRFRCGDHSFEGHDAGVNLYAQQQVDGRDRQQIERLCRYVKRPPLSQERLHC